jgi:hypothetical protein
MPTARPQDAVNGTNPLPLTTDTQKCACCLKPLPPGSGSRYCSGRCRLRSWAVRELAKALHDGTAEGIREAIQKLSRSAGGGR